APRALAGCAKPSDSSVAFPSAAVGGPTDDVETPKPRRGVSAGSDAVVGGAVCGGSAAALTWPGAQPTQRRPGVRQPRRGAFSSRSEPAPRDPRWILGVGRPVLRSVRAAHDA